MFSGLINIRSIGWQRLSNVFNFVNEEIVEVNEEIVEFVEV